MREATQQIVGKDLSWDTNTCTERGNVLPTIIIVIFSPICPRIQLLEAPLHSTHTHTHTHTHTQRERGGRGYFPFKHYDDIPPPPPPPECRPACNDVTFLPGPSAERLSSKPSRNGKLVSFFPKRHTTQPALLTSIPLPVCVCVCVCVCSPSIYYTQTYMDCRYYIVNIWGVSSFNTKNQIRTPN